jgi:hypothetical protein
MGFFKNKADPISERSRQLTARIADLESKIQRLNNQAEPEDHRRLRSTAYPNGASSTSRHHNGNGNSNGNGNGHAHAAMSSEPVFERVDLKQIKEIAEPLPTTRHENEKAEGQLGFWQWMERLKRRFRGPPTSNPKLVNYLAAGNIQGLRPLRYEKRVARNRFVALTLVLVIVLFGLFCFLARRH